MYTRYNPPFPSSHPHVCHQVTMQGHPQKGVTSPPLFSSSGLWLSRTGWSTHRGHLQIIVIIQQGFSNLHQHHLKSLFQMYTLFEPKLQSVLQSGIWPRNLHFLPNTSSLC